MYQGKPIVIEPEIIDDEATDPRVGVTLDANAAFNARLEYSRQCKVIERTLRQTRDAVRVIALLVAAIIAIMLSGCSDERTWANVERERHRIADELTKAVPAEHHENIRTIVFARPRQQPESASRGFVQAASRINQERIALAATEARLRAELRSPVNPAGSGELPRELRDWQAKVIRARRILMVAELAPSLSDWGPVIDQLVSEELAETPSKVVPRKLPPSESLRLERARSIFGKFLQAFDEVQP